MLLLVAAAPAMATFSSDVTILDKKAITALTDEKLLDSYMDTTVEIQANQSFYTRSGFVNDSEFKNYKALLKYRLELLMEIHNRNIEVPQFDL